MDVQGRLRRGRGRSDCERQAHAEPRVGLAIYLIPASGTEDVSFVTFSYGDSSLALFFRVLYNKREFLIIFTMLLGVKIL